MVEGHEWGWSFYGMHWRFSTRLAHSSPFFFWFVFQICTSEELNMYEECIYFLYSPERVLYHVFFTRLLPKLNITFTRKQTKYCFVVNSVPRPPISNVVEAPFFSLLSHGIMSYITFSPVLRLVHCQCRNDLFCLFFFFSWVWLMY